MQSQRSQEPRPLSLDASEEVIAPPGVVEGGAAPAIYEETQLFAPWVYGVFLASLLLACVAIGGVMSQTGETAESAMPGIYFGIAGAALAANVLVLRTRVAAGELYVALGLLPIFWTRINVTELTEARIVTYRPLRDSGGWGMRFGRFEGRSCRYWNARGNRGVFIAGPTRRIIIGSQQPELLYRALEAAGLGGR